MNQDLDWLLGHKVERVTYDPETQVWSLVMSSSIRFDILTPWRILTESRIALSSRDHGQKYGLPGPVDGVSRATELIGGRRVERILIDDASADLCIELEGGAVIRTFNDSSGWEAWIVHAPQGQYIAQGGGNIVMFPAKCS